MRSLNETESRVVRYRDGKENMVIQKDAQGNSLISVGNQKELMLTENGNRDICVADFAGQCVVVVDDAGKLLFRYHGNISQQSKYSSFSPLDIASDVLSLIHISEPTGPLYIPYAVFCLKKGGVPAEDRAGGRVSHG